MNLFESIIIAIVEGLTEYLPVSSTGHMIITEWLLKMQSSEFIKLYTVAIQLGAILAVIVLYFKKFFQSFDFYLKLFVAFLPSAVIGFLFNDMIDELLESPLTVAIALVLGGVVLLFTDRWFAGNAEEEQPITYTKALKIGALIGEAAENDAQLLYDFGEKLGIAFQLQDDILDVYGDPEKFGKQVGGDIISNKKTFLLIRALELAQGKQKEELQNWLSKTNFDAQEKVAAVTAIYNNLNIQEIAKKEMESYAAKGLASLNKIAVDEERKSVLKEFADMLMLRDN